MRLFPVLTAILVVATLYGLIFERDRLFEFAGRQPTEVAQQDVSSDAGAATAETAAEATPNGDVFAVVAIKSKAQEIASVVLVRGRTEAARQVDVRAETSGKIISDPLRKGAVISAGDILCELDPGTRNVSLAEARARLPEATARIPEAEGRLAEAEGRVVEAEARLAEAEINLNAAKKLFEDGYAAETRVKSAQAGYESALAGVKSARAGMAGATAGVEAAKSGIESAEARIAAAEKEIERLIIKAPFDGFLESDAAETGSLLQPGSLCATVIQLDPVKLVGFVPELDVSRVKVGARAGGRLSDGTEILGKVTFISRSSDPNTRTFRVEVIVPNEDGKIRDGQTVEMGIEAAGLEAHLLPMSALTLNDDGDPGVRLVSPQSTAEFQPIQVLRDSIEGIWVAGLPESADVIVVGQEYVIDGVPIKAAYREADQ